MKMTMNCPKCNKPNREKAVFCKWCGTNVVTKATEPLRELVGMETVKNQLQDLVNTCESLALRAQRSGCTDGSRGKYAGGVFGRETFQSGISL